MRDIIVCCIRKTKSDNNKLSPAYLYKICHALENIKTCVLDINKYPSRNDLQSVKYIISGISLLSEFIVTLT